MRHSHETNPMSLLATPKDEHQQAAWTAMKEMISGQFTERRIDILTTLPCLAFFFSFTHLQIPASLLLVELASRPWLDWFELVMPKKNIQAIVLFMMNVWWILHSIFLAETDSSPLAVTLVLLFLSSVLKTDVYVWAICFVLQLVASLVYIQATRVPLLILLVTGMLEMDCNERFRSTLFVQPQPNIAPLAQRGLGGGIKPLAQKPAAAAAAGGRGGNNAVHRLFMKAFGNYDQFSNEVTRYVNEVESGLSKRQLQMLTAKKIEFGSFELERKLASGGFCTVFRGNYKGNRQCAVKSFSSSDQLDSAGLCGLVKEIVTLIDLEHPNIIRVYGYCWLPQVCLVMEYMPMGTLHDMLVYKNLQLGWDSPLTGIAIQISDALQYLHSRTPKIIHRDLKARNILMKDFRSCKLADFGLLTEENSTVPRAGTLRYVAPEVATGEDTFQQNRTRSDIWSFGVCMWEMATRAQFSGLPFEVGLPGAENKKQRVLFHSKLPYPIPMPVYEVIDACLEPEPELRVITAADIHKRLTNCLDMVLSDDRSSWFTGNMTSLYSSHVTNDLSVDASQAWRMGSAMWRNTADVSVKKEVSSSRSLEAALVERKAMQTPPPPPQQHGGFLSRLAHLENQSQAEAYEKFATTYRGNLMMPIPEQNEQSPSPSLSKQSLKSSSASSMTSSERTAETPPFVEQRLPLQADLAANRFLARMEPASRGGGGALTPIKEESQTSSPQIENRFLAKLPHDATVDDVPARTSSMLDRLSRAERETSRGFVSREQSPSGQDEDEPKTLLRANRMPSYGSETEYAPVDYNAMYQHTSCLNQEDEEAAQQPQSMLNRLAMAEKQTSRSLQQRTGGELLSRLGQAENETTGPVATMQSRLIGAEKESSRSFQVRLQANSNTNEAAAWLNRVHPQSTAGEEMEMKSMWDRLDRVEKQSSRSLYARFEPAAAEQSTAAADSNPFLSRINFNEGSNVQNMKDRLDRLEKETSRSLSAVLAKKEQETSEPSAFLNRIRMEHDEDEGMINRLDRAEKQTSRGLFAKLEEQQPPTATTDAASHPLLSRIQHKQDEDEGMLNRLDRVEKQTSRSLTSKFQEQPPANDDGSHPLLTRIQHEENEENEDKGMLNRLDRVEKQTSRSLAAKFQQQQSPPVDDAPSHPLLSRIRHEQDEDKGMLNRLDRVEKQTSRSLVSKLQEQPPANDATASHPFLARIQYEQDEDEGMINRLDRAEKQTSRSLFARFEPQQQQLPQNEQHEQHHPLLTRIKFENEDEGMLNRLDRAEKQTSRSLFARFENSEEERTATPTRLLRRISFEGENPAPTEPFPPTPTRSPARTFTPIKLSSSPALVDSHLVGRILSSPSPGAATTSTSPTPRTISPSARHFLATLNGNVNF